MRPRPGSEPVRPALPRRRRPQRGWSPWPGRGDRRCERRKDGRLRGPGRPGPPGLHRPQQPRLHQQPGARRHGLPRRPGDTELLGLRPELRAPGPHVRAQRLLEPARAPVHGLGVVGPLHHAGRPPELSERPAEPGQPSRLPPRGGEREHPRLRLDRPHLSAPQQRDQLGLLHRQRQRARLRERLRRHLHTEAPECPYAGDMEPAAVLRHREGGRPAGQHPASADVRVLGPGGVPPRGLLGRPVRARL